MSTNTKRSSGLGRFAAIAAVLILVFSVVPSAPAVNAAAQKEEKKDKRLKMEFKNAQWATVFEWLSDQTGLPYASKHAPPLGTFSFSTPGKTYTLEEVTILLNDQLLKQDYVLLRRRNVITLLKLAP